MGNYITQCGKEGYPSPDDLEMDHHFLVMYNQQILLAAAQNDESFGVQSIKYVVLPSMCEGIMSLIFINFNCSLCTVSSTMYLVELFN